MNTKKWKLVIFWFVFILPIGLLIGIGIYKFHQPEKSVEENPVEQTIVDSHKEKRVPEKKESDDSVVLQVSSKSESNFIEERPSDDFPKETSEEEKAEPTEKISIEKKELADIYVPLTKSLFYASDVSIEAFRYRITQSDRPVSGRIYYQQENGLIESLLSMDGQGVVHEVLYSYDPAGNPVDEMEIGLLVPNSPEKKYATLSVNKLSVFEQTTIKSSDKRQEQVTEYFITPQLYFKRGKTFIKLL